MARLMDNKGSCDAASRVSRCQLALNLAAAGAIDDDPRLRQAANQKLMCKYRGSLGCD